MASKYFGIRVHFIGCALHGDNYDLALFLSFIFIIFTCFNFIAIAWEPTVCVPETSGTTKHLAQCWRVAELPPVHLSQRFDKFATWNIWPMENFR